MGRKKKLIFVSAIVVATLSFFVYQKVLAANAPDLKEGSYLTGQTLSVWPSWSLLGNSLGVSLPTDPINQLATAGTCAFTTNRFCIKDSNCPIAAGTTTPEKCVLHDPETGWSVADRRFTFACSKDSYAYRYIASTTPGVYTVRAHFEDTGLAPANNSSFISSFVNTGVFKINDSSGVCNFDQEISSMQAGSCGDGKLNLNKGEQCDPPGRIEYANGCVGSTKNLNVCNSSCQWVASTTLCSGLSKCGNGAVEFGETCDDGSLNGKYNKCNITCNGKSAEYCGDTNLQSAYEVCDTGTPGLEKYSLNKNSSCAWDCQNWGPYCGDALVQTQHGEECDGSQPCTVDGSPGVKVCTSGCLKTDRDAVAWWRFESLVTPTQTADGSDNNNDANCVLATCPKSITGKYGHAFGFTQNISEPRFFTVPHSASLTPTTSLTVEAWIYPISTSSLYQRIIEKGGPTTGKGYDLEFNISADSPNIRFNLWSGTHTQTAVDSHSPIALNTWTHVVGTYQRSGTSNIAKIYINGVLEGTNSTDSATPIMGAVVPGDLTIGKSVAAPNNYFFGNLDEIKVYNRVLSASAVLNNYQGGWYCAATSSAVAVTAPGTCGDNVINSGEECDRGAANNGRACVPAYGAPCSYCSADCQNTIDVQPLQYCGNGIIESSEKCEVAQNIIYSVAPTNGWTSSVKDIPRNGYPELACANEVVVATHTIQKGTKSCADCGAGTVRNCVKCGLDVNGVSVEGSVINVLENPISNTVLDPLFAKKISNSSLSLSVSECVSPTGVVLCADPLGVSSPLVARDKKNSASADLKSYTLFNPYVSGNSPALLSSNPLCSTGDTLSDKYQMYINNDWAKPLNFPVVAQPQSSQYDMVLSPVVSSAVRPKDLRVVVSWVGSGDFYSGVLNPFAIAPQSPQIEGAYFSDCPSMMVCFPPRYLYATGTTYYNLPANFKKSGTWYHGFNSTPGQTSAESFTIDTSAMSGNTYSFYVRAPSYPIRTFKNTAKLKVDVYLPENDSDQYHFGKPVKTYYLLSASPSDNQNARYWEVFNINAPSANLSAADIIDINAIVTGPTYFQYTNPLIARPICTEEDWQTSVTYSSDSPAASTCYAPDTKTTVWTKKPTSNCVDGVQHSASETVTCPPLPTVYTPPACTIDDWQSSVTYSSGIIGICYAPDTQTTAWSKKPGSDCVDGVGQPATVTVTCPVNPGTAPVGSVPTAPQNLRVVADASGNTAIWIQWNTPSSNGGSPITSYRVYRTDPFLPGYVLIATVPSNFVPPFKDTGLSNGTSYSYRVRAVNAVGNSPFSNTISATP